MSRIIDLRVALADHKSFAVESLAQIHSALCGLRTRLHDDCSGLDKDAVHEVVNLLVKSWAQPMKEIESMLASVGARPKRDPQTLEIFCEALQKMSSWALFLDQVGVKGRVDLGQLAHSLFDRCMQLRGLHA